jgi:hypothetical protein
MTHNANESLVIIVIEKNIALQLKNNKEQIIDKFATSSKKWRSLFLL